MRIPFNGNPNNALVQREIADDLAILGLLATTPTTPSSQAGGTGATTWNIDVTAGDVVVGAVHKNYAAQASFSVHSGTMLVAASQSVYARLVEQNSGGTLSMVAVAGTAATTGSEVAPTDAEVQTALGATVTWRDLALLHLTRDGTTGLTQTQNNQIRTKTKSDIAP